ncbi:MAG: IclR family transcriptional regulator [Proteobacteria bacterium]|nr:IclR family transcriptional regulator [Pseudomonadota bacterium]MCZ6784443.1 IclR family transcriptional regulator [Pseudomonadota bacterium]
MESAGTVEKAVDVLFHLHAARAPQGVTAIGQALGMPKSSTHRLLSALGRRGLVERDERGQYRTGIALVALGLGALEGEPVVAAGRPVLEAQAREVGETFFLVAARAGKLRVLDKAEGSGFLRAAPQVGSAVPVHATAVGKLYLAFGSDQVAQSGTPLKAFTPRTLTEPRSLQSAARAVRRRGWALNRDEWIPGLSVLAAPIRTGRGGDERMVGAVALAAATPRLEELGTDALARRVRRAAEQIAARLEVGAPGRGRSR